MKKLQLIIKILIVVLITAVAFGGIYIQKQNRMVNIVKDYSWGMDIEGARVLELEVSDETKEITKDKDGKIIEEADKKEDENYTTEQEPVNPDEAKTADNYNATKNILEKRLGKLGVNNYIVKLDEETGKIVLEIPENDEADHTASNISQVGKFEIVDSEDSEKVLINNSDIKKSNVLYNTTTNGTAVILNIEFNKEGAEKLKNISTEYAKTEDSEKEQTSSESTEESKDETKQKQIKMQIDGNEMITTSFDSTIENGTIQLTMGQATTDREKINEYIQSASTIATVLDTGNLPLEYKTGHNHFISSDITKDILIKIAIAECFIAVIALLFLIIKHKKIGILATVSYIGFIATYLLLIRYTNVTITLEGISAIATICVLNYVLIYRILNKIKKYEPEERAKAIKDTLISFSVKIIPICILSVVFCFISWMPISSFGMVMFWGLALIELYNITLTRSLLKQ